MRALTFWKKITMDRVDFLGRLIALLTAHGVRYCVIGGQAVNAYADPVVSLDLDLVVATDQLLEVETFFSQEFKIQRFPHRLNVSAQGSNLRVQLQTDPRYAPFIERASLKEVLGLTLPVAAIGDLLRGKIWAAQDKTRRGSKRQKDLADIARLLEGYPELRRHVPQEILDRLV
jgi:hypothetical protein